MRVSDGLAGATASLVRTLGPKKGPNVQNRPEQAVRDPKTGKTEEVGQKT